jgi:ornithine decarboxylase
MEAPRLRTAVSPLRRQFEFADPIRRQGQEPGLPWIDEVVAAQRPSEPLHCIRPATIISSAQSFVQQFRGDVLYAVKCNPDPRVLHSLWQGGIRHYDCASPAEVALVRQMFSAAHIHYMHPIKSREAIAEAICRHGVSDFAFDSSHELDKILDVYRSTGGTSAGLGLILRLAVANTGALHDLSGKFGACAEQAAGLLVAARAHAARLGLSFHVGSQCLAPRAYGDAVEACSQAIARAGVPVEVLDVGGGFPTPYVECSPPPLGAYFAEIEGALTRCNLAGRTALWAEPGRALVASGASVVVQVQLRRGDVLYINDGVYGSLSDAGRPGLRFPARLVRPDRMELDAPSAAFRLFGPTCDTLDYMAGPFLLPQDVREGDWIEIGQMGAYGGALRTAFNGFDRARMVEVRDPPMIESLADETG